ncbi:MAG: phosphoserine transaminase [Actinobacteria bacterium]|nr:phosphoserine transaminase [Actinomycetota bacterium]
MIEIPRELLPEDGRFGSGPSRVRPEAAQRLAKAADLYLGTSHRRTDVKSVVGRIRADLRHLFSLPEGWEVVLGNGGTTAFWDAAAACLVERRSEHLAFGEFSSRFAGVVADAPHLETPEVIEAEPGSRPDAKAMPGIDSYCLTHNETSTGVSAPVAKPAGADENSLVLVDATSAAGAIDIDLADAGVDAYYFAPQKVFAADGGLWIALMSPAALERSQRLVSTKDNGRWIPASLDLVQAAENSAKDQTLNTPALATLFLMCDQLEWMVENGGLAWSVARSAESSSHLYQWAEASEFASPFVTNPDHRSPVTVTIDLDESVSADDLCAALRANGIVDLEGYRKLGRNQIRIATFPATPPEDIVCLTACVDFVADALRG